MSSIILKTWQWGVGAISVLGKEFKVAADRTIEILEEDEQYVQHIIATGHATHATTVDAHEAGTAQQAAVDEDAKIEAAAQQLARDKEFAAKVEARAAELVKAAAEGLPEGDEKTATEQEAAAQAAAADAARNTASKKQK